MGLDGLRGEVFLLNVHLEGPVEGEGHPGINDGGVVSCLDLGVEELFCQLLQLAFLTRGEGVVRPHVVACGGRAAIFFVADRDR